MIITMKTKGWRCKKKGIKIIEEDWSGEQSKKTYIFLNLQNMLEPI